MSLPSQLYRPSLSLLTDLYQLTMSAGYFRAGVADRDAVFHLFFRRNPFSGGFSLACGLAWALDFVEHFSFEAGDLDFLATLRGSDDAPLFDRADLERFASLKFHCDIDAVPEGTVVFPHEPLVRVRGPIVECQLLETFFLNVINFQTLIATKAARVCLAARGEPVLEFGLRRAQGLDGAIAASRAAWVGGCSSTSNVLAGKLFGIPVRGTHAHSWVMLFGDEREAFRLWAETMPNNAVFLVDTYDSLDGVRHAVESGQLLRAQGHELAGVRLDSGDLAWLSAEARKILDAAGFEHTRILASSDLDEHVITSLREQGARIDTWCVGTRLATAFDDPALGGVYKLAAVRRGEEPWEYRLKLSEQTEKISTPGILGVRRYRNEQGFAGDLIYDEHLGADGGSDDGSTTIVHPGDPTRRKRIPAGTPFEELLVPVIRGGKRVRENPPLASVRDRAAAQIAQLHPGITRFLNPHGYPAGLEPRLHDLRTRLIVAEREKHSAPIARTAD